MKAKVFLITALGGIVLCLGGLALLLSAEDPFFVLRGVEPGETAVFDHERYQMPGLIRHQEYESLFMGTSLAANYRASWFTQSTGRETLKVTFPDGWISEFDRALTLAYQVKGELDTVFMSLDPNILIRSDDQRTVELPAYLYNTNPLDDGAYWFSADTYELALQRRLAAAGTAVTLDEAYVWDDSHIFAWHWAISGYPRPPVSQQTLPADAYLAAVEENLAVVCGWVEAHPDTRFVFWYPPYSILYWDKIIREGTADAVLAALDYAAGRLTAYENVALYSFLQDIPVVCNLNYYTDHVHCSGEIDLYVTQAVTGGEGQLTGAQASQLLAQWGEYVRAFNYSMFFPDTDGGITQ